jgi:capsular exopolysaccharide synthesis family protein
MADNGELAPLERKPPEELTVRGGSFVDAGAGNFDTYSHLRAYWHILFKRRWSVLTVTLVVTLWTIIMTARTLPVYRATARVEVEAETPEIQTLNDLFRAGSGGIDDAFLQTQVNVLQSENLAWRTALQLGLMDNPEFGAVSGGGEHPAAEAQPRVKNGLIQAFRGHLHIELMKDSRMVEVSFESNDPQLAARAANALVNNYVEYSFHVKYDATRQASMWMEQQLDELKAKVEKSQQAMVDYERQNAIVDLGDKQSVVAQKLDTLSQELTNAQTDRMQKESLYQLVSANESQAGLVTQDPSLQRLEDKYIDLKQEYADGAEQYGPNFPKVARIREQMNEVQSAINGERKRAVARARSDYETALSRERILSAAVAQEKAEVGTLSQLLIQHNLLKREFDTNQQLYDSLLSRLKDATMSAGLRATNIHLVDAALTPTAPVRPNKPRNIATGFLVGLVLGITLGFVRESLDNSMKSAEDLERLIPAPALAVIMKSGGSWLPLGAEKRKRLPDAVLELSVLKRPLSSMAESYRALRTAVLLSTAPRSPQAMLVTSAQPGEGKTCTASNLALGLAQRGVRVLAIDADLRRPGITKALGMNANGTSKGLAGVLSGTCTLDEALCKFEDEPNLWVLPAGPRPPNAADLLASPTMAKIMQEARQRFEHIVVDSPPILLVTDGTLLATLVDGVILVVESGVTTSGAVVRAHKVLESAGGRILGTVLNKLDLSHDGYYGTYYRGSHYPYYYHLERSRRYYDEDERAAAKTPPSSFLKP